MILKTGPAAVRAAAAFLLAALLAAVPACRQGRTPSPPAPAVRAGWNPSSPVSRRPPLTADPDRAADPARFTGNEACFDCHMKRVTSLRSSFHQGLLLPASGSKGCEECHGPGINHVGEGDAAAIRHPVKFSRADRGGGNAVCLRCHAAVLEQPVRGHPLWVGARQVACVSCHQVHLDQGVRNAAQERPPFGTAEEMLAAGATYPDPAQCRNCHPDFHPEMARSGHRELMTDGRACGACHGPGSLHAAKESAGLRGLILLPTRQDPADADRACNACHEEAGRPVLRWTCSEHRAENVACVACHDPNAPRGRTLRAPDPDLCIRCHRDAGAEFRQPSRHRVLEGTLRCNDCHDPHANESGLHRFELTREACLRCHPEKGGPFAYDHAAKRLEGCTVCHRPHGSPNSRLLETREVRTLCLSCHPGLPRGHEQRPGSVYRECLRCHVEIHGSDSSPRFFR